MNGKRVPKKKGVKGLIVDQGRLIVLPGKEVGKKTNG